MEEGDLKSEAILNLNFLDRFLSGFKDNENRRPQNGGVFHK